jgi:hypothetical protein
MMLELPKLMLGEIWACKPQKFENSIRTQGIIILRAIVKCSENPDKDIYL